VMMWKKKWVTITVKSNAGSKQYKILEIK
jgi:hypothetical protein